MSRQVSGIEYNSKLGLGIEYIIIVAFPTSREKII